MNVPESFRALVVREKDGRAALETVGRADLGEGDVTVAVRWSSLNYKDALAVTGKGKVLRRVPMIPGIDLAGEVIESGSPAFRPGDRVLATGYGLGEAHPGGYAGFARLRSEWLVPVPDGLSPRQAMAIGTAGFTAMLCAMALEDAGVRPGGREVLVTGAAGGVGSVAVAVLARAGFRVAASTGRPGEAPYLEQLGASRIVARSDLARDSGRPLESETWAGAVDSVGGVTLATVLKQVQYGGAVAACGLAGGSDLPASVFPFILRGVRLQGVDSVQCPRDRRAEAWRRLATALPRDLLDGLTTEIALGDVGAAAERILAGAVRGRVVVDVMR